MVRTVGDATVQVFTNDCCMRLCFSLQLDAAMYEIHEIFFEMSTKDRMAIIALSRAVERERMYKAEVWMLITFVFVWRAKQVVYQHAHVVFLAVGGKRACCTCESLFCRP